MKKSNLSIFDVIVKLLLVLFTPMFLAVMFFMLIIGAIIDFIAYCQDSSHLSESETKKRKTDRQNSALHNLLNLIIDYFKMLIS